MVPYETYQLDHGEEGRHLFLARVFLLARAMESLNFLLLLIVEFRIRSLIVAGCRSSGACDMGRSDSTNTSSALSKCNRTITRCVESSYVVEPKNYDCTLEYSLT